MTSQTTEIKWNDLRVDNRTRNFFEETIAQAVVLAKLAVADIANSTRSLLILLFSTLFFGFIVVLNGKIHTRDDINDDQRDMQNAMFGAEVAMKSVVSGMLLSLMMVFFDLYWLDFYIQVTKLDNIGGGQDRDANTANNGPSALAVKRISGLKTIAWLSGKSAAAFVPAIIRSTAGLFLGLIAFYTMKSLNIWGMGSSIYNPDFSQSVLLWCAGCFSLSVGAPFFLLQTCIPILSNPYSTVGKLISQTLWVVTGLIAYPMTMFLFADPVVLGTLVHADAESSSVLYKCLFCLHPVLASGRMMQFALITDGDIEGTILTLLNMLKPGSSLSDLVMGDDTLFSLPAMFCWLIFDIIFWSSIWFYIDSISEGGGNRSCFWCVPRRRRKRHYHSSTLQDDNLESNRGHRLHELDIISDNSSIEKELCRTGGGIAVQRGEKIYPGRLFSFCCLCPKIPLYFTKCGKRNSKKSICGGYFDSYFKSVYALKDVSCVFPAGQVTALLGHNGAGKSTLINCILGFQSINGIVTFKMPRSESYRVGLDNEEIFQTIKVGYVPQGDALDHKLSAEETLYWFATLRGYGKRGKRFGDGIFERFINSNEKNTRADLAVNTALRIVGLDSEDVRHVKAKFLSGGQKRRLAIGIAILGDPAVIILDEPTAGIDAMGKVVIRQIIKDLKRHGKCVILTTHAMHEAEILADHTIILARGKVLSAGTTLAIKAKHGQGYYLHVAFTDRQKFNSKRRLSISKMSNIPLDKICLPDQESKTVKDKFVSFGERNVAQIVKEYIPGASLLRKTLVEEVYILPLQSIAEFPALLRSLDVEKAEGRIPSYGLEQATLEEVFIRLTLEEEARNIADSECQHRKWLESNRKKRKSRKDDPIDIEFKELRSNSSHFDTDSIEIGKVEETDQIEAKEIPEMVLVSREEVFSNQLKAMFMFSSLGSMDSIFGLLFDVVIFSPIIYYLPENVPMYINILNTILLMMCQTIAGDLQHGRRTMMVAMGLPPNVYWLGQAILHIIVCFVYSILWTFLVYVLVSDDEQKHQISYPLLPLMILIFITGMTTVIIGYIAAMLLKNSRSFGIFYGIIALFSTIEPMLREVLEDDKVPLLQWICFLPFSAVSQGCTVMRHINQKRLWNAPPVTWKTMLSFDPESGGIGQMILFPILSIGVLLILLTYLENRVAAREREVPDHDDADFDVNDSIDDDVIGMECGRFDSKDTLLSMKEITKIFPASKGIAEKTVLRKMCLDVKSGNLVGLLGPNGAGKSTLMKIITGELCATSGEVSFAGKSVKTESGIFERNKRIYIAQQHNESLNGKINPEAHLLFYAAIKGIPFYSKQHYWITEQALNLVGIQEHKTKGCSKLSGGTQRKVCAAIALLGPILSRSRSEHMKNDFTYRENREISSMMKPNDSLQETRDSAPILDMDNSNEVVALMDEISAGVDVSARRAIWEAISSQSGTLSGVLCTHHMEEADSLCQSIAVLINGRVSAFGTSAELKDRFAACYRLSISIDSSKSCDIVHKVKYYVENELTVTDAKFGNKKRTSLQYFEKKQHSVLETNESTTQCTSPVVTLIDENISGGRLEYDIDLKRSRINLATIFERLESQKRPMKIIDYSLAQPTLEQVFLELVRKFGGVKGEEMLADI